MISTDSPNQIYNQEVDLYKLLAHPARLAILDALRTGEECVCHLEALLGYRQAYLSQQLATMRAAGFITDRRDGWNIYYQVSSADIFTILDAVRAVSTRGYAPAFERKSAVNCPCPKCNQKTGQNEDKKTTETH